MSDIIEWVLELEVIGDRDAMEVILNAIRRSHAASIMADVGLTIRGVGAECLPDDLPIADWTPKAPSETMQSIVAAYGELAPVRPNSKAALDEITVALSDSGEALDIEDLGGAFIRSARLGAEFGAPRLLLDVSYINNVDHGTGIQRVVRRISENLVSMKSGRRFDSVQLVAARDPDRTRLCYVDQIGNVPGAPVEIRTADTLLMLDAAWEAYPTLAPGLETVRQYGGRILNIVHDIVPLRLPAVVEDHVPPVFERWFHTAVAQSDALICVSKATADDVAAYIKEFDLPHRDGLQVGWWHLGSDLPVETDQSVSEDISRMVSRDTPTFLMVGTVEPRKRHVIALDAMEMIWAAGKEANLLILGREGWNVSELARRIQQHPEAGSRLLWKTDASDADINHAYQHAAALLFPSQAEGYGLPVVEAANQGLGTIASDIPSLREIGGEGVTYVTVDNTEAWADAIAGVLSGEFPNPSIVKALSWQESAQQLLAVLDEDQFELVLRT